MNALAMKGSTSVQFGTPERVEYHLDNWRRWQRTGQEVDGFPGTTPGTVNWSIRSDVDGQLDAIARRNAQIVDTILDNLPPVQRIAVYIERGIMGRVFQFKRVTYHQALVGAKEAVGRELSRRGVW